MSLPDCTGSMPLQDGERLGTVCEGDIEASSPHGSAGPLPPPDQTYCDAALVPKEFVETF